MWTEYYCARDILSGIEDPRAQIMKKKCFEYDYDKSNYVGLIHTQFKELRWTIEKEKITENTNEKVKRKYKKLEEMLTEEKLEKIQSSIDKDARQGYKSEDNDFFGYKSHVAMTRERIVTALEVTSGEAPDGKFMQSLIEQSKKAGLEVKEVIGDKAYSGKDNLEYGKKNDIKIISRIHPIITNAIEKAFSQARTAI